ncbi:MAG: IS30 family transposase [Candidatus Dormiibacterota bacterium]
MRVYRRFTESEQAEIWDRIEAGESVPSVAVAFGHDRGAVRAMVQRSGGSRPRSRRRRQLALSAGEREEISRGLAARQSARAIAAKLGRAPSTVTREIGRNGGRSRYRAGSAERRAQRRCRRPKPGKLALGWQLRAVVEAKLGLRWSPQQISRWLLTAYPGDPEMHVSHETIYMSLYVQGRGALRQELHRALRTGRAHRRPQHSLPTGRGVIPNMVLISERPAEVEDRAVPGHWEGDLIMGRRKTCIGTLVERSTRYLMLLQLRNTTAAAVRSAMSSKILALPVELRRSVTWDQGKEMSQHLGFTVDTGVQVYFCDPSSPWQRGTNENTNGLLRQYFPKGTDLSGFTQAELDAVAQELNERPRQTLGWMTPSQRLAQVVASTP